MKTRQHITLNRRQNGAVLIVSLMLLAIMSLIGVTAMRSTIMQEKMSGNSRDLMLAFQAAEAVIKDAEDYIENTLVSPAAFDGTTDGLYAENSNPDIYAAATWTTAFTYSDGGFSSVTTQPKYIIELGGSIGTATDDINIGGYGESAGSATLTTFRITARGTGGTDNAVILLQSHYAHAF